MTRQRYFGPYIIKQVVQGRPDVGPAYQLVDSNTGRVLRNLVTSDRLKMYNIDRDNFNKRLPRLKPGTDGQTSGNASQQTLANTSSIESNKGQTEEPQSLEIIREKIVNGRKKYLVRYSDKRSYVCDWVNKTLLDHYKNKKQKAQTEAVNRWYRK